MPPGETVATAQFWPLPPAGRLADPQSVVLLGLGAEQTATADHATCAVARGELRHLGAAIRTCARCTPTMPGSLSALKVRPRWSENVRLVAVNVGPSLDAPRSREQPARPGEDSIEPLNRPRPSTAPHIPAPLNGKLSPRTSGATRPTASTWPTSTSTWELLRGVVRLLRGAGLPAHLTEEMRARVADQILAHMEGAATDRDGWGA